MASAFTDRSGCIAQFRGYSGKRRCVRVAGDMAEAHALAQEAELLCRALHIKPTIGALARAIEIRAITQEEADIIQGYSDNTHTNVTIREAALAHPTTSRERDRDIIELDRHLRELAEFMEFSGVEHLASLTVQHVQRYIEHLRRRGYSWDGRRHRIIMLRRACRMAPSYGLRDVLAGIQLDRREEVPQVVVWGQEDAKNALRCLSGPALGICALGLCGLRPTEIIRAEYADVQEGCLIVGSRDAKTLSSRRTLPLPGFAMAIIGSGRGAIIRHRRGRYDQSALADSWLYYVRQTDLPRIPPKSLRKTCATLLIESGAAPLLVESWLGHSHAGLLPVTNRHYLAKVNIDALRPVSDLLQGLLQTQ